MVLYLRGISSTHLAYILDFMYNGEVTIAQGRNSPIYF
jgi:hypothetical protein